MHFPGCGSIIILAPVPGRSAVSPVSPVSGLTHIYPENTRRLEPFEIDEKKSGQIFFMRGSARFYVNPILREQAPSGLSSQVFRSNWQ